MAEFVKATKLNAEQQGSGVVRNFSEKVAFNQLKSAAVASKPSIRAEKDSYEHEADLIADQVLRMPEPAAAENGNARKTLPARQLPPPSNETYPISEAIYARLKGSQSGFPLSGDARHFVEPRMRFDFSKVRIHADGEAARMNRELNARAFTYGKDIYFDAGQFNPGSREGKRLLVHELSHVLQQQNAPVVQKAPNTTSSATFKAGDVILNRAASTDIRTHGNLLPAADQAHIAVTSANKLAYDTTYASPEDPFRWNIVKTIIDNHHVQIFGVGGSDPFDTKLITTNQQGKPSSTINKVSLLTFMGDGMTLPTEARQRVINPTAKTMVVSTSSTYHQVYYETGSGGRGMIGGNALAHELFGHLWLALQGVPFQHRKSLAGTSNITDPLGRPFTGSVNDYISKFAGASSTSVLQSPTYNVSPQFLLSTMQWIEQNGTSHITTQGSGGIDADLDLKWQALSNNYDILKVNPQTGVAVSQTLTLKAADVLNRMVTWANGLPAAKKTAFKNILRTITQTMANRRTGLSSDVFPQI
jgi:hypothetical protein